MRLDFDFYVNEKGVKVDKLKKNLKDLEEQSKKTSENIRKGFTNAFSGSNSSKAEGYFKNLGIALRNFNNAVKQNIAHQKKLRSANKKTELSLKGLIKSFLGLYAVQQTITAGSSFIKDIAKTNIEFEKQRTVINGLEGDLKKGAETFKKYVEISNETPYSVEEVINAGIMLKAQALNDSKDVMKTWADAAAGMGKSYSQVIEAVLDAKTGENERLKEAFGIKAIKQGEKTILPFVDKFGKAKYIVAKGAKEIEQALIDITKIKFGGSAENLSKTLGGAISNVETKFSLLKDKLATESGLATGLKNAFKEIDNVLNNLNKKDNFEKLSNGIKSTISFTISLSKAFVSAFKIIGLGLKSLSLAWSAAVGAWEISIQAFKVFFGKIWMALEIVAISTVNTISNAIAGISNLINLAKEKYLSAKLAIVNGMAKIPGLNFSESGKKELNALKSEIKKTQDDISKYNNKNTKEDLKLKVKAIEDRYKAEEDKATKTAKKIAKDTKQSLNIKIDEMIDFSNTTDLVNEMQTNVQNALNSKTLKQNIELNLNSENVDVKSKVLDGIYKPTKKGIKKTKGSGGNSSFEDIQNEKLQKVNEQLQKEIEYYIKIGDLNSAKSLEEKAYRNELIQQGYTTLQIQQMEASNAQDLIEKYRDLKEEQLESQKTIKAGIELYVLQTKRQLERWNEFTLDVIHGIEDAMNNGFNDFFDGTSKKFLDLKELGKSVLKDILISIQQMITKMLVMKSLNIMMGGISGFFANGGVFNSGVQKFATGGSFTNGVVDTPTPFNIGLMGEAGPEAIMPLTRKNGKLGVEANLKQQPANVSVNVINNAPVNVNTSTDKNGNPVLTIEEIDQQLSYRMKMGRSETDQIMNNRYNLNRR